MSKIPKVVAGYLPARYVDMGGVGTACGKCRDFIRLSSECVIVDDPRVSATRGTCTQYIFGKPLAHGVPRRLIPKSIVGYTEGPEVPTYCGRCKHYEDVGSRNSLCAKVGDTDTDEVQYGGCCNGYVPR